jgi:hypothetical protein
MKYLVMVILTFGVHCAQAQPKLHLKILSSKIQSKNSGLSSDYVKKLSNTIYRYSEQYGIPYAYIQSIFFVESSYNLNAVNSKSKDYGIGQVNMWHIKNKKLSKNRLLNDMDYSVHESVKIMHWFYKTYRDKEPNEWLARYNCGTKPSCIHWSSVKRYIKKVHKAL